MVRRNEIKTVQMTPRRSKHFKANGTAVSYKKLSLNFISLFCENVFLEK